MIIEYLDPQGDYVCQGCFARIHISDYPYGLKFRVEGLGPNA